MNKLIGLVFSLMLLGAPIIAAADDSAAMSAQPNSQGEVEKEEGSAGVLQAFTNDNSKTSEIVTIADKTKRLVMFFMGVPLLILLIATAVLGVAMGVYGKQVFVPHMVCAGLSLTLALGHAVVGIVWFYPF